MMKKNRYLPVILLLAASVSHAEPKSDQLYRASTLSYPPYQYIDEASGIPSGLAVDIINTLFQRTGAGQIQFDFYPWKRAVHLTQTGQSDLLFNAGKDPSRQQWGRYVDSVLILQSYNIFKLKRRDIQLQEDFKNTGNLSIAVRAGYLYGKGAFREALDNQRFRSVQYSDSTEQSVQMLLHERVDMFVGDYLPVKHYLDKHQLTDQIDRVTQRGQPIEALRWPTYILLSRQNTDQALQQTLYLEMEKMKQDGTYQSIINRYMQ